MPDVFLPCLNKDDDDDDDNKEVPPPRGGGLSAPGHNNLRQPVLVV